MVDKIGDKQPRQDRRGTKQEGRSQTRNTPSARKLAYTTTGLLIPLSTHIDLLNLLLQCLLKGSESNTPKMGSENIMRLKHDHHFKSTSGTRFHADHTNLRIGVVQITIGKLSEIFCSCLVKG